MALFDEVLTPVQCVRPFVWLQKSGSDVRFSQASPVAAGGAHGDLAQRTKSAKNGSQGRNGVERMRQVATPVDSEGPEEGSLLAEGVRCRENGCLSRGGSGSDIGQKSRPASPSENSAGDTDVTGRFSRSVSLA
jgi:hypothetical protein